MSFANQLNDWPSDRIEAAVARATVADVDRAVAREDRTAADLAALLSPAAESRLESMAREAQRLTRWNFGLTIGLYVPLYISNVCNADCLYCGYAMGSGVELERRTLDASSIRLECEWLAERGFQNVLLLTGESRAAAPIDYIAEAITIAREYFAGVSIEMYAMDLDEYARLCAAGLEGVTLYMETYDRPLYASVHCAGEKRDYDDRLDAIERAGRAGVRRLSIGALLGLGDWRVDGFHTALHARYLQKTCWQSAVAVSFPRLRHVPDRFDVPCTMSDKQLVQLMLAQRLFLPEAGMNLSTRESATLRDRLIPLGVTMMSAGSSTRPGGYATYGEETLEQFKIEDGRTPAEVAAAIRAAGYEPVWKDFDLAFDGSADWMQKHLTTG